jgi:hypothetical protein
MTSITLEELLLLIPPDSRENASKAADHLGVAGLVVYGDDPDTRAIMAYGPQCRHKSIDSLTAAYGQHVAGHWSRAEHNPAQPRSRTMTAVNLVLQRGMTQHAAAKRAGVNVSAVNRAIARRRQSECCPVCQQVLRDGFYVDKAKVKVKTD